MTTIHPDWNSFAQCECCPVLTIQVQKLDSRAHPLISSYAIGSSPSFCECIFETSFNFVSFSSFGKKKSSDSKYEVTRSSLQLRLRENQSYDILQPMKMCFGNPDAFWKDRLELLRPWCFVAQCEEKIQNLCVWCQRGYVLRLEMFEHVWTLWRWDVSWQKHNILQLFTMYHYAHVLWVQRQKILNS